MEGAADGLCLAVPHGHQDVRVRASAGCQDDDGWQEPAEGREVGSHEGIRMVRVVRRDYAPFDERIIKRVLSTR